MENEPIKLNESIKLSKMSKGYNWEIRILPNEEKLGREDIRRLERIDEELNERFGDGNEN